MKKYLILALFLALSGILTACSQGPAGQNSANSAKTILFYGDTCPHCKNVDKFIEENKIAEKIQFEKLEIFNNKDNSTLMYEKAVACGVNKDEVGVPFFWDEGKCIIGDTKIEEYLKEKIK
jgi:glutaredoxin